MLNKIQLAILLLLFTITCYSQSKLNDLHKLESTCKIWGFLKYYHPEVAKGKFNWDQQLIEILPEVQKATSKEQLSKIYINWIASLGKVKKCNSCNNKTNETHFNKNFDLSWINNSTVFTPELSELLKFIEYNRNQKHNYYVSSAKKVGNVIIKNEPQYDNLEFPNEYYRLLCLFKYWNVIEYFYPYKYLTDQNWNDVLTEMIPKFNAAQNASEYHVALLETIAKIDDSHTPNIYTKELGTFFGKFAIPIEYLILDNELIITGFRHKDVDEIDDLRIGDAILEINGVSIEELIKTYSKYIPASHKKGKERNSFLILTGHEKEASIKLKRGEDIFEKKIHRYDLSTFEKKERVVLDETKWKMLDGDIAYVKIGNIEVQDVKKMMNSIIDSKAIIFDIRNYPNGTIIMKQISRRLNANAEVFAKIIFPDLSYPGKYLWKDKVCGTKNNKSYKGKVVILVNRNTGSQSEYFAMSFQTAPNAITVGNQTAGADGNISRFELVGGFRTVMTGTGVFYPNGTETQRKGVKIDIEVEPTIQGIIDGRDEILEKAILLLNTELINSN